jgi:hypothetical protein
MNQSSQLTHLIWDFYRENLTELSALQPLRDCKLSRAWGSFRICCPDQATLSEIIQQRSLLNEPLSQLRLAKRIRLWVQGQGAEVFPVMPSRSVHWSSAFRKAGPAH